MSPILVFQAKSCLDAVFRIASKKEIIVIFMVDITNSHNNVMW